MTSGTWRTLSLLAWTTKRFMSPSTSGNWLILSRSRSRKAANVAASLMRHVLLLLDKKVIRGDRIKILDVEYSLSPSHEFVKSVKAATKRVTLAEVRLGLDRPLRATDMRLIWLQVNGEWNWSSDTRHTRRDGSVTKSGREGHEPVELHYRFSDQIDHIMAASTKDGAKAVGLAYSCLRIAVV